MIPSSVINPQGIDYWQLYIMALEKVAARLARITSALVQAGVPHALVGGQAVALWVATKDPAATRTTKDVDLLLDRSDLPRAQAAARTIEMDFFEVMNVGMFLERAEPSPKHAVHLLWAGEKVKADYPLPSPPVKGRIEIVPGQYVVPLSDLVVMKLMAYRRHDCVHLEDMIDVGLIDRAMLTGLPAELAARLEPLLIEQGR